MVELAPINNYFSDFMRLLSSEPYSLEIQNLNNEDSSGRISIDLDHVRTQIPNGDNVARLINEQPEQAKAFLIRISKEVINELFYAVDQGKKQALAEKIKIGFCGLFGQYELDPRSLSAIHLNRLIKVEGILTKQSQIRPKLVKSAHYCESTKVGFFKTYQDFLDTQDYMGNNSFPTKDQKGNPLTLEYGLCVYKDNQTIQLQEIPEKAPIGQLPRSIEVILEDDLVDSCKPGDRVQIVGVYKNIANQALVQTKGMFKTFLIAWSVKLLEDEIRKPNWTSSDIIAIKEVSQHPQLLDLLANSLAPSILGHEQIKKALILQQLSGERKILENKTCLRGDINILLIGDPGVAKSQLLRSALSISSLAVNTTGRGSSGVGLTAAVTIDKDTNQKHLEAGAMVLADQGLVCIDEFDKMNQSDRVAIHEVMEQQTVTIAKAGIHTTLNARCSVLAAANPVYGEFNLKQSINQNVNLPDSLLSRFDLLFIMLDPKSEEFDRRVSHRVLLNHMFDDEMLDNTEDVQEEGQQGIKVYEDLSIMVEGQTLTRKFLQRYLTYAKARIHPVLSEESCNYITKKWNQLRQNTQVKTQHINIRTLESLIRLSTAVAKAYLDKEVKENHCEQAYDLLHFSLFGQTQHIQNQQENSQVEQSSQEQNEEQEERQQGSRRPNKNQSHQKKKRNIENVDQEIDRLVRMPQIVTEEQKQSIMKCIIDLTNGLEVPQTNLQKLQENINKEFQIGFQELVNALVEIEETNRILYNQDTGVITLTM